MRGLVCFSCATDSSKCPTCFYREGESVWRSIIPQRAPAVLPDRVLHARQCARYLSPSLWLHFFVSAPRFRACASACLPVLPDCLARARQRTQLLLYCPCAKNGSGAQACSFLARKRGHCRRRRAKVFNSVHCWRRSALTVNTPMRQQ